MQSLLIAREQHPAAPLVLVHSDPARIAPRHEGTPRRCADVRRDVETSELAAFRRHPVEVRGAMECRPERPDVRIAQIVDEDHDEVRLLRGSGEAGHAEDECREDSMHRFLWVAPLAGCSGQSHASFRTGGTAVRTPRYHAEARAMLLGYRTLTGARRTASSSVVRPSWGPSGVGPSGDEPAWGLGEGRDAEPDEAIPAARGVGDGPVPSRIQQVREAVPRKEPADGNRQSGKP